MPNRLFTIASLFWAVGALYGCAQKNTAPGAECAQVHYCLNALIDERLQAYTVASPSVEKYVFLNGEEEQQTMVLDEARWEAEFSAFREADIDKPALIGKYLVDTLFVTTDSLTRVSYIAKDEKLRTRYLHLYFKPGGAAPAYIEARLETKNLFYTSVQELAFAPGEYYSINGYQNIWLLGQDTFAIKSVFKQ